MENMTFLKVFLSPASSSFSPPTERDYGSMVQKHITKPHTGQHWMNLPGQISPFGHFSITITMLWWYCSYFTLYSRLSLWLNLFPMSPRPEASGPKPQHSLRGPPPRCPTGKWHLLNSMHSPKHLSFGISLFRPLFFDHWMTGINKNQGWKMRENGGR